MSGFLTKEERLAAATKDLSDFDFAENERAAKERLKRDAFLTWQHNQPRSMRLLKSTTALFWGAVKMPARVAA